MARLGLTGSRSSPEDACSLGPYGDPRTILDLKSTPSMPLTCLPGHTLRLVSPEWSPGRGSANENKAARCLVLAISQKPGSSAPQHPWRAADQRYLRITPGHEICVAYSTAPITNNLGEFVFLINSFFWHKITTSFVGRNRSQGSPKLQNILHCAGLGGDVAFTANLFSKATVIHRIVTEVEFYF